MNPSVSTSNEPKRKVAVVPSGGPPDGFDPSEGWEPAQSGPPSTANLFRVGMMGVLLAVSMTFASLCGAYVYLVAQPHLWKPVAMPRLVWVSTALILLSSFCMTRVGGYLQQEKLRDARRWLTFTLASGIGFLLSQLGAWYELSRGGLFEVGNQQRSFFIILSVTHAVHVLAGIAGLIYLRIRAHRDRPAGKLPLPTAVRTIGLFWHFMAGIWIFLLALLLVWK